MTEPDWALVHLKKCIEKTHGGKKMEKSSREGEVIIHGGVVHCPGSHRTWTVSLFEGYLKIYCTGCKRCFVLLVDQDSMAGPSPIFLNVMKDAEFINAEDIK